MENARVQVRGVEVAVFSAACLSMSVAALLAVAYTHVLVDSSSTACVAGFAGTLSMYVVGCWIAMVRYWHIACGCQPAYTQRVMLRVAVVWVATTAAIGLLSGLSCVSASTPLYSICFVVAVVGFVFVGCAISYRDQQAMTVGSVLPS